MHVGYQGLFKATETSLLKITNVWTMLDNFLACRPLPLWKNFLKFLAHLEGNKYKSEKQEWNVLPPRCSREISTVFGFCLKVSADDFKETNLLKAVHIFASGNGTGAHG